ncbi:MAG: DUF1269 domain-containing protein [Thermosynechococcus sp. Uc]|uniref:DUF1269 domain-containing protein n=1 Tax=Thermosynechococcus sp. Uc TaxID=3034853 RepID=UPI0019DF50EE|nr:DUF1269 domain-containing protein [Thermosynechococcus sp. Uc]MDM7326738.1 DUF1269 domain-containing protein [Thermosynechococcus sp. Uc]HIK25193.1 DUF1269 domain-containing protein [Thermosynechococcus sp. M46_R2017_013]
MSTLVVIAFDDEYKANEVLIQLLKLQREHLIDLEDAAVVVRTKEGKVKINQTQDLTLQGALGGGFWGLLIGLLFFNPLLGWAAGLVAGAISGKFTDIGIDDNFIKELGQTISPGSSAIFTLVRQATPDKVIEEIAPFGGKVLRTSLSKEDEAKLQEALNRGNAASQSPIPSEVTTSSETTNS